MKRTSPTIQDLVNAAVVSGSRLHLPAGVFTFTETIDLSQLAGFQIIGAGNYDPMNTGPGWSDAKSAIGTKFVWAGPAGGIMFDVHGSLGISFHDVVLDGDHTATGIAGWDEPMGWAFSRLRVVRCRLQNCTDGIRFGNAPTADNSDLSILHDVSFARCGVGIRVVNDQSVGHVWECISNEWCTDACIVLEQGGQVSLRNINQDGPNQKGAFVRVGAGGSNVGVISIDGGHLESGTLIDASNSPQYGDWKIRVRSVLATVQDPAGGYTSSPLISASQWPKIDCVDCDFNGRTVQAQPNVTVR